MVIRIKFNNFRATKSKSSKLLKDNNKKSKLQSLNHKKTSKTKFLRLATPPNIGQRSPPTQITLQQVYKAIQEAQEIA